MYPKLHFILTAVVMIFFLPNETKAGSKIIPSATVDVQMKKFLPLALQECQKIFMGQKPNLKGLLNKGFKQNAIQRRWVSFNIGYSKTLLNPKQPIYVGVNYRQNNKLCKFESLNPIYGPSLLKNLINQFNKAGYTVAKQKAKGHFKLSKGQHRLSMSAVRKYGSENNFTVSIRPAK